MTDEPAAKKAKIDDWAGHTLNISHAVMKEDEGRHFAEMADDPISTLEGIGPHSSAVLDALKITTIRDLATYKYFLLARAMATLAETEEAGKRPEGSVMNVDKGVDKDYEAKSLKEIVDAPIHVIEGLTENSQDLLKQLGVKSIGDLGSLKYCRWAEAICELGKYEHTSTAAERHAEREAKKLE